MEGENLKHIDLFSGIGGFALATEMVWGKEVEHTFCDNEPFSQAILKKHWPNSKIYGDIRSFTKKQFIADTRSVQLGGIPHKPRSKSVEVGDIHILTGGFPCQPFSQAGRRAGTADDRHLWPEMLRVIQEFHPRWIIGENVGGFVTWSGGLVLEQVHADLESEGYEVQAFIIPAVSLNAPHRRDRIWIVAHDPSQGLQRQNNAKRERKKKWRKHTGCSAWNQNWTEVAAQLCTLDDGLPNGLARPRGWRNAALKGAGNAIVPQVAAEIMFAIKEIDSTPTQSLKERG